MNYLKNRIECNKTHVGTRGNNSFDGLFFVLSDFPIKPLRKRGRYPIWI